MIASWNPFMLAVILAASMASRGPVTAAQANVTAFPPHATAYGKTLGEWGAAWWQWLIAIPSATNPVLDLTGQHAGLNQSGPVFFLAGTTGIPQPVNRSCSIPCKKEIFFPLANILAWDTADCPQDQNDCRSVCNQWMNKATYLECKVDGIDVPGLGDRREEGPFFDITVPPDNLFNIQPPGKHDIAYSDGFWVMIAPLSIGEHTIQFRADFPDSPGALITYDITSVPEVLPPHFTAFGKTAGEWGAEWWRWVISVPPATNPLLDLTGEHAGSNQSGPVFFLVGTTGAQRSFTRSCSIPHGKAIFFPICNVQAVDDVDCPLDKEDCRIACNQIVNKTTSLECLIDGVALTGLGDHREEGPFFDFIAPPENIFNNTPGKHDVSYSDGFWLMLPSLPPGEHTIHFRAGPSENPDQDVTYHITQEPGLLPPHFSAYGKTAGEWAAEWWKWGLGISSDKNPLTDLTGKDAGQNQSGPVFFLAGVAGTQLTPTVTRSISVPCGKALFFPFMNFVTWAPTDCSAETPEDCRAKANHDTNRVTSLECTVDGMALLNLANYREESPYFRFTVPADNLAGIAAGEYGPASTDGFWLMLEPRSPGWHFIHFRGTVGPIDNPDFFNDVLYTLEVAPCPLFRRGDFDDDSNLNLTDAIAFLEYQFLGGQKPPCLDSADVDDSGHLDINDPVYLLTFMYLAGDPIPYPGPWTCGEDLTPDDELEECDSRCSG